MIAIAQYSASSDDQETAGWFFVFQEIKEPPKKQSIQSQTAE